MPTLKSGNGELENGSSEIIKSPGFLSYAMNKASAVLWIIGATVATDVAAQQAPNNFAPNVAALTEPAVSGNAENASQIPTAQTIIDILRNGKETIKRKFSTYNDAVFQQIVGQIGLGTVKSETLIALAWAFPKGSIEQENILSFSKTISTPKQPVTLTSTPDSREKKLPPLNETNEEKTKRLAQERLSKVRRGILDNMNKEVLDPDKWRSVPVGKDSNDSAVKGKKSNWAVVFSINANANKWQSTYIKELPPGKYTIKTKSSDGKIWVWWKGGAEITLNSSGITNFELVESTEVNIYVKPNSINPQITIHEFNISETQEVKIVQQGAK